MQEQTKPNSPLWVSMGLANIQTRKGAMMLFWGALVASVLCIPLSYYLDDWSWAAFMFPVALWYWLCIRWMDRNEAWD